jgi:hypothetical protein
MSEDDLTVFPVVRGADDPSPLDRLAGAGATLSRRLADEAVRAANASRELASGIGARAQRVWVPEDADVILTSPSFAPFPDTGPAVGMLSIAWQTDALVGLSAMGVTCWEDDILSVTRSVFHDGPGHADLSRRLFGADFDAIHRWIDTVPGSGIRGGGITHRLKHGHDLAAAQQLYAEHGLPGLLVWMQHVAQDVSTPTGIPIPLGGPALSGLLVEQGLLKPAAAARLLSFNAATLVSRTLGSAFALRVAALATEAWRKWQVRRRCVAAQEAWARGDLDAVVAHYGEARSLSGDDPTILIALGWAYGQMGRPAAESFLAFRAAAMELAKEGRTVVVDGATLSLRGLAYTLALSQSVQVLEEPDLRGAWRSELDRMLRGAVTAFERTAVAQADGPSVRLGHREMTLSRERPLSAAANYYLAARLARSAAFLPTAAEAPRLTARALDLLTRAGRTHGRAATTVELTGERWRVELSEMRITSG